MADKKQPSSNSPNSIPPSDSRPRRENNGAFNCYICLNMANHAVLTLCGHLFCWRCLYQWLNRSNTNQCPFCRSEVRPSRVIPILGGSDTDMGVDCCDEIPARPAPPREIRDIRREVIKKFLKENTVGDTFVRPDETKMESLMQSLNPAHQQLIRKLPIPPESHDSRKADSILRSVLTLMLLLV